MHGDFINGWFSDVAENMLKADDNGKQKFTRVTGAHGTKSKESECAPEDSDPNNGTSDYETSLLMMEDRGKVKGTAPVTGTPANGTVVEESCNAKRSIGSTAKRDAARRALTAALEALDALDE